MINEESRGNSWISKVTDNRNPVWDQITYPVLIIIVLLKIDSQKNDLKIIKAKIPERFVDVNLFITTLQKSSEGVRRKKRSGERLEFENLSSCRV